MSYERPEKGPNTEGAAQTEPPPPYCLLLGLRFYGPERSPSQELTFGQRPLLAPRPVMRPTCPASSGKNSLSSLPTRPLVASACGRARVRALVPAVVRSG